MNTIPQDYPEALERKFALDDILTNLGKNDFTPFPFQADGVRWLSSARTNNKGFDAPPLVGIVGDEMGLGKTAQALLSIKLLVRDGKRFLILVPGSTAIQWQKNWDRWISDCEPDEFGDASLLRVTGTKQHIPRGTSVVMSHSLMARADIVKKLAELNFDGIIIDEIHKFGTINVPWGDSRRATPAQRTTHLWALRNLTESKFESARIGLTGTPTRNYAREAFNLAHFVDPARFRNFQDFANKYLSYDLKSLHNPRQFHDDFAPYYIRRTVAEVQKDLPPCRRTKLYTEISDPILKMAYNKELDLMSNFLTRGRVLRTHDEDAGPQSLLGYLIRLRHITGIAKAKEPAIIEPMLDYLHDDSNNDSDDNSGNKIVIGLHHQFVYERLAKSLGDIPQFTIRGGMSDQDKENTKLAFIEAKNPAVLLLSVLAGGEGIDGLQTCCRKAYVFERQWNGAAELQFEKRIVRTGQKYSTSIEYTIASGTIDEFFDDMVEQKRKITNNVEDVNWETDGTAMRQLAEKIVMHRL